MLEIKTPPPETGKKSKLPVHVLYLHENQHLTEQTAKLLNSEWPRSLTARLQSLEKSFKTENGFPLSLLLIGNINSSEEVIGHGKVFFLFNKMGSCYVESVVLAKAERRKGYGRLIMTRIEEYVRIKGIKWIYLKTKDQQEFYSKLGYEICQPFTFCESSAASIQTRYKNINVDDGIEVSDEINPEIETMQSINSKHSFNTFSANRCIGSKDGICVTARGVTSNISPPPPPPPPPVFPATPTASSNFSFNTLYLYMKKQIT